MKILAHPTQRVTGFVQQAEAPRPRPRERFQLHRRMKMRILQT